MVLFSIACETCASRLNVKQTAAIGQVLACPKCGSMVHVQPPEGWEPPESEHPVSQTPRPPRNPHDSQATVSGELGDLSRTGLPKAVAPKSVTARRKSASSGGATAGTTSAPPVQEVVDISTSISSGNQATNAAVNHWEADGTGGRSNAKAWIAGVIGICLIALVLILYMLSSLIGGDDPPENVASKDKTNAAQSDDESTVDDSDPGASGDTEENKNPVVTGQGNTNPKTTEKKETPSVPESDAEVDSSKADPPKNESPDSNTDANKNPNENPNENPNGAADEDPLADIDKPLEDSSDPLTMEKEDQESYLDGLKGLGGLVQGIDMDEFRSSAEDQTRLIGIGKVYVPVPRALEVNPPQAIAETYPGLAFKDQTLLDFSQSLFNLAQVPVQLDSQAIVDGQLDPFAKVNAVGKDISVEQLLNIALQPIGLTWNWNDDKSVIVLTSQTSNEIVLTEIELAPVFGIIDEPTAAPLITVIQNLIAPESWTTMEGKGTVKFDDGKLKVEQSQSIAKRVQHFVTRMELAARLNASPEDIDLAGQLVTAWTKHGQNFNTDATVEVIQHKPILQVLAEVRNQDGMTLVPNWTEMANNRWNPLVTIPWKSIGLTNQQTLQDLTTSMNLAYRILNDDIIEITSKHKLKNATRIEIFPCHRQLDNNFSPEQIIKYLKEGIAGQLPKSQHSRVDYLPQYKCIVALLPDPLLIQAEKILEQLAGQ